MGNFFDMVNTPTLQGVFGSEICLFRICWCGRNLKFKNAE